nr:MAG TPA: hypothetical protein [Caudoviricetes sp.]
MGCVVRPVKWLTLSRKRPSKAINSTPNTLPRNLVM